MNHELFTVTPQGKIRQHFHRGQWRAWQSERRIVAVIAGTQSGKTTFGPHWMYREIQQRGPGDYMVVTPTFPLLELKALPEFNRLFEETLNVGKYKANPSKVFTFSPQGQQRTFGNSGRDCRTNVFFGYAADPDSLESATAKAAWCDEAGQKKFKLESLEAILRRLSIYEGRILITTTIYNLGWLKSAIYDPWRAGDPGIDVISFSSVDNPAFPRAEYQRAEATLPRWKFDMFYRAIFTRPAGLIYDSFRDEHKCPRFTIDPAWKRYLGLDFGGVNTVGVFYAEEPETGRLYLYRTYRAGGRTAAQHAENLLAGEIGIPVCFGGAKSEQQWRDEFRAAGLPVKTPLVSDVEVGIDRVYGMHSRGNIIVFDDLLDYLAEKLSYSRELDERGEPTEAIEDKEAFHFMDAERYVIGSIAQHSEPAGAVIDVSATSYKSERRKGLWR